MDEVYDTMRSLRYARVSLNYSLIDRFQPRTLVSLILLDWDQGTKALVIVL